MISVKEIRTYISGKTVFILQRGPGLEKHVMLKDKLKFFVSFNWGYHTETGYFPAAAWLGYL